MDRFKDLPDDIISKILTHLKTRDAVRTCVLSRDWENKWISVDKIEVNASGSEIFTDFMYKLLLSSKSRIQSCRCRFRSEVDGIQVRSWISTILKRQVQILAIQCLETTHLPTSLIYSTSLIDLTLSIPATLNVPPTQDRCFQNLKTLYLCQIELKNYDTPNNNHPRPLLLSFPVLENLELQRCIWSSNVNMVEIRAPALICFEFNNRCPWHRENNCRIKICAPKLETFESYNGSLAYFDLSSAPTVAYLCLLHTSGEVDRTYALLSSLSMLLSMTITGELLEPFLELAEHTSTHLSFGSLQYLDVTSTVEASELLKFLQLTPILKELILTTSHRSSHCDLALEIPPKCVVSSLKKVVFRKANKVGLLEWFLDKASLLEKISHPGISRR